MNFMLSTTFKSFRKFGVFIRQCKRCYENAPINFATNVIIPRSGEDLSLTPIVYHHGLTGSKELWNNVPQLIANLTKRRSYTYDARNHGDSPWSSTFSYMGTVEDLKLFMDQWHIKKAIVVGHSMGGWTVSMFALKYPDMVELFVNEDMTLLQSVVKETVKHTVNYIKLWQEGVKSTPPELDLYDAYVHAFIYLFGRFPTSKNLEEQNSLNKFRYPIKRTEHGYDVKHNMAAICNCIENFQLDTTKELNGVYEGLGYFMMAENSHFYLGMDSPEIKKAFPNVEMEVIPGVTHNIHIRYPDVFIARFLAFYDKHYTRPN